jgi:Flp pilus assembly secretin CpaC
MPEIQPIGRKRALGFVALMGTESSCDLPTGVWYGARGKTIFRFSTPFSTAVIGAPEIADVLPTTEPMLYVQGKKIGATNISVFDQQRRLVSVIDLDVTPDTTSLQNKIAASTGGRDINVTSANGEIV